MAPELYPKIKAVAMGARNPKVDKDYRYDAKAVDIYAMGVCLFEMRNLSKPYKEEMNEATMSKIIDKRSSTSTRMWRTHARN